MTLVGVIAIVLGVGLFIAGYWVLAIGLVIAGFLLCLLDSKT